MKCPTCGCENFYLKDMDDQFEIYEFATSGGKIEFIDDSDESLRPEITSEIETFCNKCAWHGEFKTLK